MIGWSNEVCSPRIQCVYVAVPHFCYSETLPPLLKAKFHVLQEKPAAESPDELETYQLLASANSVVLETASQRRYGWAIAQIKQWMPFVGAAHTPEATRKLAISHLARGWRAKTALSGGGALGDIGWHLVDQVLNLVGQETAPEVKYSKLYHTCNFQGHDCEESAKVILDFNDRAPGGFSTTLSAHLMVSRFGHEEVEEFIITGEDGVLISNGKEVSLQLFTASGKRSLKAVVPEGEVDFERMFKAFHEEVLRKTHTKAYCEHQKQDILVTQTLNDIYQYAGRNTQAVSTANSEYSSETIVQPDTVEMEWPIVTANLENAVMSQLHKSLSIYDNSGVFERFDNLPNSYALLHNLGSNALYALFFAAGFRPRDEVIFPVYTFHATCSPAMHFGITPIFCDAAEDGNISPHAIAEAITTKTKAVVITHLWGTPCDMKSITSLMKIFPDILLLEDCSHAHGGKFNWQPLGTFGDGAAWSLQGQKIATGGEGAITLTKHADFHYRQLIWGHYNKRCKTEIPTDHPLRSYSLTGAGLKTRAHPLAVVVALDQLHQLESFHAFKIRYAKQMIESLEDIAFLEMPYLGADRSEPAWYAFIVKFKASQAPKGLTRDVFVKELNARGLNDVDIPKSTSLLHKEPLFNHPEEIFPHLYPNGISQIGGRSFNNAQQFYDEAVKLPVYATADGEEATNRTVALIKSVAADWYRGTSELQLSTGLEAAIVL